MLSKFETDKIRDVLGKVNLDHYIKENYKVESGEWKKHLESNPNNNSMMQVLYYYLSFLQ